MTTTACALTVPMNQNEASCELARTTPIIHLIEDNPVLRDVAGHLFKAAGWEVCEHVSAEAFLAGQRPSGDACLVVDIMLPGMSGLDLLELLSNEGSQTPVVMLSGQRDVGSAISALKVGAVDYLEKPANWEMLFASVSDALKKAREERKQEEVRIQAVARLAQLTKRENEVMMLILDGKPNKIIAFELCINQRTVENHRANVMRKTGASSLPALVNLFLESGRSE